MRRQLALVEVEHAQAGGRSQPLLADERLQEARESARASDDPAARHRAEMSAWLQSWDDRPLSTEPRW